MKNTVPFGARWSRLLTGATVGVSILLLVFTWLGWDDLQARRLDSIAFWGSLLAPALLFTSMLFTIRSYGIAPEWILIQRLLWTTRLPRAGLRSAVYAPESLRTATRTFGNGGLFSCSGWFRSPSLGPFRAWVTDEHRTVILTYEDRVVVLSPEDPANFVRTLQG